MVTEQLLFRRQFVLGRRFVSGLPTWQRASVGDSYCLTAHPDLGLVQETAGGIELTLLGYLLDPEAPELDDRGILQLLLSRIGQPADLFPQTSRLGGRWVLIASGPQGMLLFTDPAGLRQVVYAQDGQNQTWCATQPHLLAEILDLEVDRSALEFLRSPYWRWARQAWWPGDTTPYAHVKHLLPNRYLDLDSGSVHRFWPAEPLRKVAFPVGVEQAADLLERLMFSAYKRFPLAVGITAGQDSRVILAATRRFCREVYFFTHLHYELPRWDRDVQVPRRLLARVGLEHHLIDCPDYERFGSASDEESQLFRRIYYRSVTCAHEVWAPIVYAMLRQYPAERVLVKGNLSELARCNYYKRDYPLHLDGEGLARRAHMLDGGRPNPYAVEHFGRWLSEAEPVAAAFGHEVLDLFHWEQRSRWQAQDQAEHDLVQEAFTPFACRDLQVMLLGVDAIHRREKVSLLHREIRRRLWPHVLDEPVNPPRSFFGRMRSDLFRQRERRRRRRRLRSLAGAAVAQPDLGGERWSGNGGLSLELEALPGATSSASRAE